MKIISIIGNPHGLKGNTARLLSMSWKGAKQREQRLKRSSFSGTTVLPCLGCDTCHRKGVCPQKDEFEFIKEKIFNQTG